MFPIQVRISTPEGIYTLECDEDLAWAWRNEEFIELAWYSSKSRELTRNFVQDHASTMLSEAGKKDRKLLVDLLRQMNVAFARICDLGGEAEVKSLNLEAYYDWYYRQIKTLPVLSFVNHKLCFDQFFFHNAPVQYRLSIACMGNGPFLSDDLLEFASDNDIGTTDEFDADALILGHNNWTKADIDRVIDMSRGSVLRIYSQEMFVSVLAGQYDPFDRFLRREKIRDLYSFRARHEGLIYVSKQWADWPHTFTRDRQSMSLHGGESFGAQQSPLHALGYRVGQTGEPDNRRREVLTNAFKGALPPVESAHYMRQWGEPNAGRRLQRIAEQLAKNIERQSNNPTMANAIRDWRADLQWLGETFYRGTFTFDWPGAIIYTLS